MTQRRTRTKAHSEENTAVPTDLSFEDAYAQMQEVVSQLEMGDLSLDGAVLAFERGMRLAQHCNTLLDRAELRVQAVAEQPDGTLAVTDITIETE